MNQNNEVKANNAVEKPMAPLNPTTPAKEPRHAIVPDKPDAESPHVIAKQSMKEGNSVNQNNEVKTNSVVEKPATPPNPTNPAKDPKRVIGPNKSIELAYLMGISLPMPSNSHLQADALLARSARSTAEAVEENLRY